MSNKESRSPSPRVNEGYIGREALADEAALLFDEPRYWLREIILNADGEPRLAGRTVVPESTLCGPELALQQLGQTRWGDTCSRRRR